MKHDELAVPERELDRPQAVEPLPTRPTPWTDFSKDNLQHDRPVSQSAAQNCTCKCYKHKNVAATVDSRYTPKLGNVARATYQGCDCVEYRPVLPKGVRAGNWIVERGN